MQLRSSSCHPPSQLPRYSTHSLNHCLLPLFCCAAPPLPTNRQAVADRARQEVQFWKNQLDHAVEEKNALLDRYTALYRHAYELEQYAVQLGNENYELQHVLERTLQDERRAAGGGVGSAGGAGGLRSSLNAPLSSPGGTPLSAGGAGSGTTVSLEGVEMRMCWFVLGCGVVLGV